MALAGQGNQSLQKGKEHLEPYKIKRKVQGKATGAKAGIAER